MGIPLSIFIGIYALGVLFIAIMAGINMYHIVATGTLNLVSFAVSVSLIVLMVVVLVLTGLYLAGIDTSQALYLFNNASSAPLF